MKAKRQRRAVSVLSPEDLALAVFGPQHVASGCSETKPSPSWHPRVRPAHLERLWLDHEAAITAAATAAGLKGPWIVDRLFFLAALRGEV